MRGIDVTTGRTVPQVQAAGEPEPEQYTPDPDYADWSDEDVDALVGKATREARRRRQLREAKQAADRAAATWQAASGRKDGDAWAQPQGAHDSYPQGAVVTHDGKEWESLTPANVWEPGVSGWHERVEDDPDTGEPGVPAWVAPTGAHDAYGKGDRVSHDGAVWVSDLDGNVWKPGEYGWTVEP